MPRRRFRFDKRALFAVLMLAAGVFLPLLSSFSASHRAQVVAAALPTAHLIAANARGIADRGRAPTSGQALTVASGPT